MIRLKNVSKTFYKKKNAFVALDSLSFDIPSKSLVVLTGNSGAGKTTLLNILGGLDFPSEGDVFFGDEPITIENADDYRSKNVGYVFQEYNLLNNVSVAENLKVAFDLSKEKATFENMMSALSLVGLPDKGEEIKAFLKKRPVELSGGQRQRVAIARALIKNPNILLLDEPTGALDENNSISLLKLLKKLSEERLVVLSTHNLAIAKPFADRFIKLHEGKLIVDQTINEPKEELDGRTANEKQGFLSFTSVIRSALRSLKTAKLRLITSILLSTIITGFLGVLVSIETAERNEVALRSQYDAGGSSYYQIFTKITEDDSTESSPEISEKKLRTIEEYYGDKKPIAIDFCDTSFATNAKNSIYDSPYKDETLFLRFVEKSNRAMLLDSKTGLYDASLERDSRLSENVQCRLPEKDDEIALTDFQAQYLLELGLKERSIDSLDDLIGEELVGDVYTGDPEYVPPKYKITGIFRTGESLEQWRSYRDNGMVTKEQTMSNGFSQAQLFILAKTESRIKKLESSGSLTLLAPLSGSLQTDLEFIRDLSYKDGDGKVRCPEVVNLYSSLANKLVVAEGVTGFLIYSFTVVAVFVSLLLSLNLFYANVKGMEKELGILRALGAKKRDIRAIVFAQGGMIWLIEFALSMLAIAGVNSFLNNMIWISLLYANWIVITCVFLTLFVGMVGVSWLSSIKAIRQKPVNVIDDK